ncbi:unnamed protein product [Fusarium graminearum]|nr:unnamed protein product [Fusarium graminearum]
MESAAWLTAPIQLTGSRAFTCDGFTEAQCSWYMKRWHFWYIADHVYALPTVAFFMSGIGLFTIGHLISYYVIGLAFPIFRGPRPWRMLIAMIRYLSYRGFHVASLGFNSAPIGVLLLGLVGTIFFFCMDLIPQPYYWPSLDFGGSPPLGTRSGWLALGCMPFVFATATKTNWITLLTGVSHERLQVFHRWIAYAFFVFALLHTFPFIVYHIRFHDMQMHFEMSLLFYWTGIVALIFQAWLTFASHSAIRKLLGYEFFKATHFFAVVIFMLTFFWHCDYTLTSWHYFIGTAAVYVPCYVYPWLRTCFEYGVRAKAHVKVEDNGFVRVTIPANFTWEIGQHCFLRFTGFGIAEALSAHPFTICSLPTSSGNQSFLVFYLKRHKGFTAKLYEHALQNPGAQVSVMVDGPYGGINTQSYVNSSHLVVIAGGSGAGWTLPFIEQYIVIHTAKRDGDRKGDQADKCLFSSLRVILASRDIESCNWYRQVVSETLLKYSDRMVPGLNVQLYRTGGAIQESTLPSNSSLVPGKHESGIEKGTEISVSFDELHGRPDLPGVVKGVANEMTSTDSLGVYVCGPDTMQNDVRNTVASLNLDVLRGVDSAGAYLHSEHFSWA